MAQLQLNTADALGPIRDRDAIRVCSLSGILDAKAKVVSLEKLRDGLEISIHDLERQRSRDQMLNKALLVARFTKASCDAFLSLASDLASVLGGKVGAKQAELVDSIYETVSPLVEATSASVAGQKVDWVKTGAASMKKGASLVTDNKGYQILTQSTAVKVEIINSAMNQDKEGIFKSAASYLYDLHATLLEIADAKKTAAFAKIAKDAFEYNEKIGDAFDQMLEGTLESEQRYLSLKTSLSHSARRLSAAIGDLEDFITSCEDDLGVTVTAPVDSNRLP